METSASFEARYAPSSYPTTNVTGLWVERRAPGGSLADTAEAPLAVCPFHSPVLLRGRPPCAVVRGGWTRWLPYGGECAVIARAEPVVKESMGTMGDDRAAFARTPCWQTHGWRRGEGS
jgi:hypothetical protein